MKHTTVGPERTVHWPTILWYIYLHIFTLYGLHILMFEAKWLTVIFAAAITLIASLGITAGAHRLWAHASYTASTSLRGLLMLAHTLAGTGNIFDWVLAHRIHHKFYGTDRDPYNHKKGFFYSHVLTNLMTKHPNWNKIALDIDMRDADFDGFLWIQKQFYWILFIVVGLLLPINAPIEYWGESVMNSIFVVGFLRLAITTNVSWLVNSGALIWGLNPGEKYPNDSLSTFFITRSFWPHYHYALPWDYKSGEFGNYDRGCTTTFIKIWENLGLASGLKTPSSELIRDALAMATSEVTLEEALKRIKLRAEEEAIRAKLVSQH